MLSSTSIAMHQESTIERPRERSAASACSVLQGTPRGLTVAPTQLGVAVSRGRAGSSACEQDKGSKGPEKEVGSARESAMFEAVCGRAPGRIVVLGWNRTSSTACRAEARSARSTVALQRVAPSRSRQQSPHHPAAYFGRRNAVRGSGSDLELCARWRPRCGRGSPTPRASYCRRTTARYGGWGAHGRPERAGLRCEDGSDAKTKPVGNACRNIS